MSGLDAKATDSEQLKAKRRILAALLAPGFRELKPEAQATWARICPEVLECLPPVDGSKNIQ